MKRFVAAHLGLIVVLVGSTAFAQAQPNEHLKGLGPFIGTWRFEGPSPEGVPGFVEKGSQVRGPILVAVDPRQAGRDAGFAG